MYTPDPNNLTDNGLRLTLKDSAAHFWLDALFTIPDVDFAEAYTDMVRQPDASE